MSVAIKFRSYPKIARKSRPARNRSVPQPIGSLQPLGDNPITPLGHTGRLGRAFVLQMRVTAEILPVGIFHAARHTCGLEC